MAEDELYPTVPDDLRRHIDTIARTDAKVLITGATGVGKETVARAIHQRSSRAKQPFIAVDCGLVPEAVLEAELFGYVKGTFHDDAGDEPGKIELAHRGTLFLGNVDALPWRIQGLLLHLFETGHVQRLGSDHASAVDIRVIAATSRNLMDVVREGTFREDFYYRLIVLPLEIPPLHQRRHDIPLLVQYFIKRLTDETGDIRVSSEALAALTQYDWPENVRELHTVLETLTTTVPVMMRRTIELEDLPEKIRGLDSRSGGSDFEIRFPEDCSPSDVKEILMALADYYRVCGGLGFEVTFESEDVPSWEHVGA
jgi:DNA-binding NtrC family response regulator